MTRRGLIAGTPGMLAGLGGLGRPRVDQTYNNPGSNTSPGQSGVFRGRQVVLIGNGPGTGLFEYTGPGQMPVAWAVAPGVLLDPFGNALPASGGFAVLGGGGIVAQLATSALHFFSATSHPFSPPSVVSPQAAAAGANLFIVGGAGTSGAVPVGVSLWDSLTGATGVAQMVVARINNIAAGLTAALLEIQGELAITAGGLLVQAGGLSVSSGGARVVGGAAIDSLNVNGGKAGNAFAVGGGPSDFAGTVYFEDSAQPATPGTSSANYSANGNLKYVSEDGNAYSTGVQHVDLPSTSIVAVNGAFTNVGPAIAVGARKYKIHINGAYTGAAAGIPRYQVTSPAIASQLVTRTALYSAAGAASAGITAAGFGAFAGPTMATGTVVVFDLWGEATFTAAGSLQFQMNTNSAADNYTFNGGTLELYPIA